MGQQLGQTASYEDSGELKRSLQASFDSAGVGISSPEVQDGRDVPVNGPEPEIYHHEMEPMEADAEEFEAERERLLQALGAEKNPDEMESEEEKNPDEIAPEMTEEEKNPDEIVPEEEKNTDKMEAEEEKNPDEIVPEEEKNTDIKVEAKEEKNPDEIVPEVTEEEKNPDEIVPEEEKNTDKMEAEEEKNPDETVPEEEKNSVQDLKTKEEVAEIEEIKSDPEDEEEVPVVKRTEQWKLKPPPKPKSKAAAKKKAVGKAKAKSKSKPKRSTREKQVIDVDEEAEVSKPPNSRKRKGAGNVNKNDEEKEKGDQSISWGPVSKDGAREFLKNCIFPDPVKDEELKSSEIKEDKTSTSESGETEYTKSFARRPCPKTSPAREKWIAIRGCFNKELRDYIIDDLGASAYPVEDWGQLI